MWEREDWWIRQGRLGKVVGGRLQLRLTAEQTAIQLRQSIQALIADKYVARFAEPPYPHPQLPRGGWQENNSSMRDGNVTCLCLRPMTIVHCKRHLTSVIRNLYEGAVSW